MLECIVATIAIATVLFLFYYWSTSTFNFWKSRNVPGPKPLPWFGNVKDFFLNRLSVGEIEDAIYNEYRNEDLIGMFITREPVLMVANLDLIRDVLLQDFVTFSERGFAVFGPAESLTQHLVNLELSKWRPLRHKFSPAFTSGKLKKMFYLLLECGEYLEKYLNNLNDKTATVECTDLMAKFLIDVTGLCFFGVKTNALDDKDSTFRKVGQNFFDRGWKSVLKLRIREYAPWLYTIIVPFFADRDVYPFFSNILKETMKYRKTNGIVTHDFIDIIMELRNHPDKIGDLELTDELLTAQMFIFFLAGYKTTSITLSHSLYELAQNQGIQDKLRDEISSALAKNNGQLTYELIKSMKYLDMVFKETLRKYPPGTSLRRKSREPYTFAGTKLTIPAGIRIVVPVLSIHRNPSIYPEPEVFDPERFTDGAVNKRHPMSWLAFGDGPRNCIGTRLAHDQYKVGLIKVLLNRRVEVCEKTQIPYIMHPQADLMVPRYGMYLKFTKIN